MQKLWVDHWWRVFRWISSGNHRCGFWELYGSFDAHCRNQPKSDKCHLGLSNRLHRSVKPHRSDSIRLANLGGSRLVLWNMLRRGRPPNSDAILAAKKQAQRSGSSSYHHHLLVSSKHHRDHSKCLSHSALLQMAISLGRQEILLIVFVINVFTRMSILEGLLEILTRNWTNRTLVFFNAGLVANNSVRKHHEYLRERLCTLSAIGLWQTRHFFVKVNLTLACLVFASAYSTLSRSISERYLAVLRLRF